MHKCLFLLLMTFLYVDFSAVGQTSINYNIPYSCHSSAAVYLTDGTLIRTLWRNEPAKTGHFTKTWDNKDDQGILVQNQQYMVKLLYHNVGYKWDGPIGNTSEAISGKHVFQGFYPIMSMAATDTANFYVTGYNENAYNLHWFKPENIHSQTSFGRADTYTAVGLICTDGKRLYIANNQGGFNEGGTISFVYAISLSDKKDYHFSAGHAYSINYRERLYESIIDFDNTSLKVKSFPPAHTFIQHGASGIAVQENGTILAIAHFGSDSIRLFDKNTGRLINKIFAADVTALGMTPANDLWAISGNKVICYSSLSESPVIKNQLTGFSKPLALAIDPINGNLIIADGGSSQQIKAYSANGLQLFTIGQAGGYLKHNAQVTYDKFWFRQAHLGDYTFITVLKDHSFWFGDTGNNRSLHFNSKKELLGQIMFQPTNYSCSVDINDASRVFSEYLEFKVDYTKPLGQSWTLIKNWLPGLDPLYFGEFNGIRQVTTLKNKKTYALLNNQRTNNKEIIEITTDSIRLTHISPANRNSEKISLQPNGSIIITPLNADKDSAVIWYRQDLLNFTASGDPVYDSRVELGRAAAHKNDPVSRFGGFGDIKTPVTSTKIFISFDQSRNSGFHLGGIKVGGKKWLWRASPTGDLDDKGTYDIGNGVQYAGSTVMSSGRNIIYGYHGEFWKQAQAARFMHFYDDGLFIGEFGESSKGHNLIDGAIYGFAGNSFSPSLVQYKNRLFLWVNDESSNGPQRWQINGLKSIHEISGKGRLNGVIILSASH